MEITTTTSRLTDDNKLENVEEVVVERHDLTKEERLSIMKVRYGKFKTLMNIFIHEYIISALDLLFSKYPFEFKEDNFCDYVHNIEMLDDYMDISVRRYIREPNVIYVSVSISENPNANPVVHLTIDNTEHDIRVIYSKKYFNSIEPFEKILKPVFPDYRIYE